MNIKIDNHVQEHENAEIITDSSSENNDIKRNSNESLRSLNRKKGIYFNNAQLGILFNIFKNGLSYVYRFVPTNDKGNAFSAINKDYEYGLNMVNLELEMIYTRHYDIDKNPFLDPLFDLYDKMNANRTLLLTNKYKSVIHAEFFDNVSVSNESIKLFKQVLNRIANGVFRCDAVNPYDAKRIMDLCDYSDMLMYINSKHNCTKYLTHKAFVKYVNYFIKDRYKIVQIPKELQLKFNQIGRYFNEIKNVLKLNDKNGFYSYTVDEIDIPVMCKHEYMTFEGVPPAEISIECYRQGKCKYCGQELNAYHEQIKESLPPRIYDLIYKYIATINENIEVDSLMYVLFNLLFDAIQVNVKTSTVKNYDASVVAFAALFLYKIYTITKGKINYNNKVGKFLDSIKEYGSAVGWSQEKMNTVLNDSRMFANIENITNIIKEKIYTNDIKFLEFLPLSIMFNQNVDPREKNKLVAKTKIQELYLEGNNKMILFNDVINKAIQALWKFTNLNEFVKVINKINVESKLMQIKTMTVKNGERFFNKMCKIYCPVDGIHSFDNNKECKYCGIKNDLSNKKEIYDKYQNHINNSYLQKPNVIKDSRFNIEKKYNASQIDKYNGSDLFEKYIMIENHILKQIIDKSINNGEQIDEIVKLISVLTTIEKDDIKKDPMFIRKALSFIVDQNIKSSDELLNELEFIYLKIDNIQLLLI